MYDLVRPTAVPSFVPSFDVSSTESTAEDRRRSKSRSGAWSCCHYRRRGIGLQGQSRTGETLTVGGSVQASRRRAVGRVGERLLGETRVAGPEFQGDTVARVRAGVETEIGVVVLYQAVSQNVEPLVVYRWIA
jgi:hypothetical protein